MPHARVFPFGGRKKPQDHQNPVAWFPVQLACSSQDFIPIIKVAWQTENKPLAHPELSVYHFQVRTNTKEEWEKEGEKNYFPDLEASSERSPTLTPDRDVMWLWLWPWQDSRVEPCAVAACQGFFLSQSRRRSHRWVPMWPRSSLFPGIESSSIGGSLPWSRWLPQMARAS